MKPNNPVYHFLRATFQVAPDDFAQRYLFDGNGGALNEQFYKIIKQLTKTKLDKTEWVESNDEVIDAWGELVGEQYWESITDKNVTNPFEFLKRTIEDVMILEKDQPCFRIKKSNDWNFLTFQLGEDLFSATLLANRRVKYGYDPNHFQWRYILRSNFIELNELFTQKKPNDNHAHLGGTSPNVDLSWLYLMNFPYSNETRTRIDNLVSSIALEQSVITTDMPYNQRDMYTWIQVAAYIRMRLFQECCLEENSDRWNIAYVLEKIKEILESGFVVENDFIRSAIQQYRYQSPSRNFMRDRDFDENRLSEIGENKSIDYAIIFPERNDLHFYELSGERSLYFHCLKKIFEHSGKNRMGVEILFYLYLLVKNRFNSLFVQKNKKYGFDNFQKYQNPKSVIIRGTYFEKIATRMAIHYNIEENNMEQFESRIVPYKEVPDLREKIKSLDKDSGRRDKLSHFYVLHFLKDKKSEWFIKDSDGEAIPVCRDHQLRLGVKEKALAIKQFRAECRAESFRIFGIDAASHEVNCRPEVFGQAFRFLSDSIQKYPLPIYDEKTMFLPQLKKTYHVGEDFYDMIDGLQAIDEAVLYLKLKHGDRIGHGVALGLCPEKYYQKRKMIAMPLQNILDNYAWMLYKINEWCVDIPAPFCQHLKNEFEKYFNRIYNHNKSQDSIAPDLLTYIEAWKFRGDDPACFSINYNSNFIEENIMPSSDWEKHRFRNRLRYKDIRKNVYELVHRYHFDEELKREAKKIEKLQVRNEYIHLTKQLQIRLRNDILERGIGIESCPSSNYLISNLKETIEMPTFKLFPIDEDSDLMRLNVSINTDDQGVFYTSLNKEYALLATTLQQEKFPNGTRKYSNDKILTWIEKLIGNGKAQCFRR